MPCIKVLIADRCPVVVQGLRNLLGHNMTLKLLRVAMTVWSVSKQFEA